MIIWDERLDADLSALPTPRISSGPVVFHVDSRLPLTIADASPAAERGLYRGPAYTCIRCGATRPAMDWSWANVDRGGLVLCHGKPIERVS